MESRIPAPASYRLRELIVHAREGSPIAMAAIVGFIESKLPQISPQLVLSFAERILENFENDAFTTEKTKNRPATDDHGLKPWPRNDHAECSTANRLKVDASTKAREKGMHRSSADGPRESLVSLRRVSG